MRKLLSLILLLVALCVYAQKPFKGKFVNKKNNINLVLDLYEESIEVPGMEFLGKTNGFLNGNIYGTWLITHYSIKDSVALISLTNDYGSDKQDVRLTILRDSTPTGFSLQYEAIHGNEIEKVVDRKLVSAPAKFILK